METLQRTANRGSISTGGYEINNSLKIEDDNTEHMTRTYSEAGVKTKGTISFWHKRTEIQSGVKRPVDCYDGSSNNSSGIFIDGHRLCFDFGGNGRHSLRANALMRDTSAWYHLMATWDTSQGTDSNRTKIYINGEQVTDLHEATYPSQNAEVQFFTNTGGGSQTNKLFCQATNTSNHPNGYFAEFHYVNNSQLSPTDFGEYDSNSGIWKPKEYTGTYGDTGFYLDFADASDLGDDESGNGNDFTEVNIAAADQATDSPTNNFATQNVIWGTDRMPLMSQGATEIGNNVNAYRYSPATMGVAKGKWYWEIKPTVNGNTLVSGAGIASNQTTLFFYDTTGNFVYHYDGDRYVNGAGVSSYGAAWSTNDIIGFAYDADNWTLTAYVNNSSQGNLLASQTDISSELFIPYVYSFGTHTYQTNFGGYTTMSNTHTNTDANGYGSFVYAPPSGYYALCSKNLAEFG